MISRWKSPGGSLTSSRECWLRQRGKMNEAAPTCRNWHASCIPRYRLESPEAVRIRQANAPAKLAGQFDDKPGRSVGQCLAVGKLGKNLHGMAMRHFRGGRAGDDHHRGMGGDRG